MTIAHCTMGSRPPSTIHNGWSYVIRPPSRALQASISGSQGYWRSYILHLARRRNIYLEWLHLSDKVIILHVFVQELAGRHICYERQIPIMRLHRPQKLETHFSSVSEKSRSLCSTFSGYEYVCNVANVCIGLFSFAFTSFWQNFTCFKGI